MIPAIRSHWCWISCTITPLKSCLCFLKLIYWYSTVISLYRFTLRTPSRDRHPSHTFRSSLQSRVYQYLFCDLQIFFSCQLWFLWEEQPVSNHIPYQNNLWNSHLPATTCNINIAGIPTTKYQCFVLCLNRYIPAHVPKLPPKKLIRNSLFSGILHVCRFAFALSTPIATKPMVFMSIR